MDRRGFTLLELVVVIIIIGVLAAVAVPKFIKTIEYTRSTEALLAISQIHQAMERCFLMKGGADESAFPGIYAPCSLNAMEAFPGIEALDEWQNVGDNPLDIDDPGKSPSAHFSYWTLPIADGYWIYARRNSLDGGDPSQSVIGCEYHMINNKKTCWGYGAFKGLITGNY